MADSQKDGPERFDPWASGGSRGASWFALSAAIHIALLFLFATVTMTVINKIEEIKVKIDDALPGGDEPENDSPSLQDLKGALNPENAAPQRVAAPSAPAVQGVKQLDLPAIGGLGPKIGTGKLVDMDIPSSFGGGSAGVGNLAGLTGGFGEYVGGLRKVGLDVVLVIDTTSSMQFAIDEVRDRFQLFVKKLQEMVPMTRIGIVAYRDKGDDYVTKWADLSFNSQKLSEFLANLTATGGGDWEEDVKDALQAATHDLKWRKGAKRIVILIGGSPPHPWDTDAVDDIARAFHKDGGVVSTIDVTLRLHEDFDRQMWRSLHGKEPYQPSPMPEYYKQTAISLTQIAKAGGGEMLALGENKTLIREILELTFGQRWKTEMAKFLKELS